MKRLLAVLILAIAGGLLPIASSADSVDAKKPIKKIFVNGGARKAAENLPLQKVLLDLIGKPNPKVCLLPTATGDDPASVVSYYDTMNQLDCRPRHLRLFHPSLHKDYHGYLLGMDGIHVGGGNTLNMLAVWRDQDIDKTLRKAWENGIVLSGGSAGQICWFEQGCTDSRPGALTGMNCLGWLKGSCCPHYNDPKRKATYHALVLAGDLKDGIGCDEGVGLYYENDVLVRVISTVPKAKAYAVTKVNGAIVERPLDTEYR